MKEVRERNYIRDRTVIGVTQNSKEGVEEEKRKKNKKRIKKE